MKIKSTVNNATLACYVYGKVVLSYFIPAIVVFCFMSGTCFAEGGVNRLAGLKADIGATFGSGSDTEYFIYLGEGLLAAIGYIKTKNIMLLGGLPLLMVFTHWALK